MRTTSDSYNQCKLTTFDPCKVAQHINKSKSRALAVIDILEKLIQNGTIPIQEARRAQQRSQPSQSAFVIHQLKSSLGNFGGLKVCNIATDIEFLLEQNPTSEQIDTLFDTLERELLQFLAQAAEWLAEQKKTVLNELNLPIQSLEQAIIEWQTQLTECNLKALDTFGELKPFLSEHLPDNIFQDLNYALEQLNFAAASQLIRIHITSIPSFQSTSITDEAHLPAQGRDQNP